MKPQFKSFKHSNTTITGSARDNDNLLCESKSEKEVKAAIKRSHTKEFECNSKEDIVKPRKDDTIAEIQDSRQSSNRKIATGSSFYKTATDRLDKSNMFISFLPSKDYLEIKDVLEQPQNTEIEKQDETQATVYQVMDFLEVSNSSFRLSEWKKREPELRKRSSNAQR